MSFRWHLARETEAPGLARGEPAEGFLSPRETALFAGLSFERRRRKWLLGRWAGKRLLAEALSEERGLAPPPHEVTIDNDPAGAPYALLGDERLPWCLSLSHRAGVALAVLAREPGTVLGADLETVEPREPALVREFFVDSEQRRVESTPVGAERDRVVARIWSAKESVLKALGVGLRLDTRAIEVDGDAGAVWPAAPPGFRPLAVRLLGPGPAMLAVTRDAGDLVVTVARLV